MLLASSRCATMARLSQKRRLMLLRRTHHNNNNGQTQLLRHFPPAIAGAGPSCSSSPPPPLAMLALPQQRSMIIMATSQHLQSEAAKSAALLEEQRSKPMKVPPEVLASNSLDLSRNGEQLTVECRQGRSGTIYFQCSLRLPSGNFFTFTTFLAPVGHGIVEALDGLMESLTTLAAADTVGKFPKDDEKHVVESRRVEHPGREFYFKLELFWLRNGFGLDFRSIARQLPTTASADQPMPPMHRRKRLTLQLRALPWLRQNLAEMLAAVEGGHAEADGFFCLARNAVPAVQLSTAAKEFPYRQWEAVTRKQELAQKREESLELATATLELGGAEQLLLRCKRGKSGLPHFTCSKRLRNGLFFNFSTFLAAPVGQRMVQAMDELLERLTDPDWDNFPRHADEIRVVESRRVANDPDCPFDFQLEIYWLRDGYGLDIRTIRCQQQQQPTAEEDAGKQPMHTEKVMQLPLRALPWLRQNLADMFAQNVATNIGQQPLAGSGAPIDGSSMAAAAQDFPLAALDIPFQRWEATVRPKLERAGKTEEKSADGVLKGDVSVIRTGGAIEPGWGRKGEQLATAVLELGGAEQLHLECRRGKSGHAFFQYKKRLPKGRFFNCTPFLAPVGKRMAEAMAELMESLAAMRDMDNFPRNNTKQVVVSRRVANAPGHPFDFQLDLFWLRDGFGLDIGIVGCQPEPDANAKDDDKSQETKDDNSQGAANIQIHQQQQRSSRPLTLPLRALPWLRQNLADMFALAEAESGLQHMPKPLNLYGDSGGDDDDGSEPTAAPSAQDFPYQRWETTIRPGKK